MKTFATDFYINDPLCWVLEEEPYSSQIFKQSSVQIIVWNSLCSKYADCSKAFILPQVKFYFNNYGIILLSYNPS